MTKETREVHSPLPWKREGEWILDKNKKIILRKEDLGDCVKNIDHVIHCVNSRNDLVEALTALIAAQYLGSEQCDLEKKERALRNAEEALRKAGEL